MILPIVLRETIKLRHNFILGIKIWIFFLFSA